jgi:hypothetical protein
VEVFLEAVAGMCYLSGGQVIKAAALLGEVEKPAYTRMRDSHRYTSKHALGKDRDPRELYWWVIHDGQPAIPCN